MPTPRVQRADSEDQLLVMTHHLYGSQDTYSRTYVLPGALRVDLGSVRA